MDSDSNDTETNHKNKYCRIIVIQCIDKNIDKIRHDLCPRVDAWVMSCVFLRVILYDKM